MCVHQGYGLGGGGTNSVNHKAQARLLGFRGTSNNSGCFESFPLLPTSPTLNGGASEARCVLKGTFLKTRSQLRINRNPPRSQVPTPWGWDGPSEMAMLERWNPTCGIIYCAQEAGQRKSGLRKNQGHRFL